MPYKTCDWAFLGWLDEIKASFHFYLLEDFKKKISVKNISARLKILL